MLIVYRAMPFKKLSTVHKSIINLRGNLACDNIFTRNMPYPSILIIWVLLKYFFYNVTSEQDI